MTVSKHTDDLKALAQEREKAKQQLNYWTQREKILSHQMAQLTPKERTHRLCTRAGMLKSFGEKTELLKRAQLYTGLPKPVHCVLRSATFGKKIIPAAVLRCQNYPEEALLPLRRLRRLP